jgi:hypothetical protein
MFRSLMLSAVMLICVDGLALAQGRLVFGQGVSTSCGSWTQARQTRSPNIGLSAQWVAGYLSGLNAENTGPDPLAGTDFDGLMAWIDNYCRANPLQLVASAADQLMAELRSRAKR